MIDRVASRFGRYEPLRHAGGLMLGMLSGLDRKNCWTIAEHRGELLEGGGADLRDRVELLVRLGDAERQAGTEEFREHLLEAGRIARELGDADMLAREERKRREWRFENALRKHNFVGFAGEVLKGVVGMKLGAGEGAYDAWIEQGKAKVKKRIDERKKGVGAGGAEDVEMDG